MATNCKFPSDYKVAKNETDRLCALKSFNGWKNKTVVTGIAIAS